MADLTLDKVAKRRKHLVRNNLWNLPKADDIEAWKQQFIDTDDKQLAMIVLDALIVRSDDSAKSSLFYMLGSVLPSILKCDLGHSSNYGAIPHDILRQKDYINTLRIQRLGRPSNNPAGGQSSDNLIRDLRYTYSVNENYFEVPESIVSNIVLVDEFCGSGNQAKKAIIDWKENLPNKTKISVFFMAIHKIGLMTLREQFSNISFYTAEILGSESCLVNHVKDAFRLQDIESAQNKLKVFTEKNFQQEKKIPPLGYRDMALCFKPPYTACNNMAGPYLLKTKETNVRLFERGL